MFRQIFYWIIPVLLFISCDSESAKETYLVTADSATGFALDSTSLHDSSHKNIKTADIKCRGNNVFTITTQLEQLVNNLNGVIVESRLENEVSDVKEFYYKTDSLKKVQVYVPTAHLTLKMPVKYLDTVVATLSNIASFINYRTLKQEDVTLQYLSNNLKNQAFAVPVSRPNVPGRKDLRQIQYNDDKQDKAIDRKIANLQLLSNVEYATFTVELFQPELTDITITSNIAIITRPDFKTEFINSIQAGVDILQAMILFFIKLWPLWIMVIAVWLIYKKYPPVSGLRIRK